MKPETASNQKHIAEILDANKPLLPSKLHHLSSLNDSDLDFLKQSWARTAEERKRQVISQLVQLSQSNFRLNFSEIFSFCLRDPDPTVRVDAITGLAEEEDYRHVSPLVHLLQKDSSTKVKEAAVTALGKFATLGEVGKLSNASTKEVYQALLSVLDDKSTGDELQCLALEAIAPFNLPQVKSLIERAYHSSNVNIKICALRAMGRNCNSFWLTTLFKGLGNSNAQIRYEATRALGELGSEEALPFLIRLSTDDNTQVQEAAIKGLGEIGGEEARTALNKLSKSPQQRVRQAAKSALKELNLYEEPLPQEF